MEHANDRAPGDFLRHVASCQTLLHSLRKCIQNTRVVLPILFKGSCSMKCDPSNRWLMLIVPLLALLTSGIPRPDLVTKQLQMNSLLLIITQPVKLSTWLPGIIMSPYILYHTYHTYYMHTVYYRNTPLGTNTILNATCHPQQMGIHTHAYTAAISQLASHKWAMIPPTQDTTAKGTSPGNSFLELQK